MIFIWPADVPEVLTAGHYVLMGLYTIAREAAYPVRGDHERRSEVYSFATLIGFKPCYISGRGAKEFRGSESAEELGSGCSGTFEEHRIGLLAGTMWPWGPWRVGDLLAEVSGLGVDRETCKLVVMRLVQPVAKAHQRDLRDSVGHETATARLVTRALL